MNRKQMTHSRRRFLKHASLSLLLASSSTRAITHAASRHPLLLSAQGASDSEYGLAWLHNNGAHSHHTVHSGFRGHSVVQHPTRKHTVLMVARRPGTQCIEVDLNTADITGGFTCTAGQHLFGHACFSRDGKYLLTTEADISRGKGVIVVRDADSWQVVSQFPSGGIGPHEMGILPDGNTLVVANGGILTHPKHGRKKLNLPNMRSSLSYIELSTGKLLGDFQLPEPKASIRHLAITDDGAVVFATQFQREAAGHDHTVGLGGVHKPASGITLFEQPLPVIEKMNDYMGSVAVCNQSKVAGFTSPRGNIAAFWHVDSGDFVGYHLLRDVCGIDVSTNPRRFILSSSVGQLRALDTTTLAEHVEQRIITDGLKWDNHLLVMENA